MRATRWLAATLGWLPTVLIFLIVLVFVSAIEMRIIEVAWLDFFLGLVQSTAAALLLFEAWSTRRSELGRYGRPRRKTRVPVPPAPTRTAHFVGILVPVATLLVLAYLVRPISIIHGPLWLVAKYPLVFLVAALFTALVVYLARVFGLSDTPLSTLIWALGGAVVAFLPLGWLAPQLSARATYEHYRYVQISKLPPGGEVRVLPREVAEQEAAIGYNLSGHTLGDGHIILDAQNGRLTWTFEQAPSGTRNVLYRYAEGIALLDAQETNRTYHEIDRRFKVAPGMQVSDNTNWRVYKHDYFSVPESAVAVVTRSGEPEFIVPVVSYKGFLVKYPVLSKVYVFHPDGSSEQLSVSQAEERSDVGGSGQLIPAQLAREIQDAYAYKHGIWNAAVGHNDQTSIVDSSDSDNHQPYLMAFAETADGKPLPHGEKQRLYWVSSAEPKGHAFATKAIFLTDALTGVTYVRSLPRDTSLTGANQAVQDAKSLAIPGVVFAANYEAGVTGGGRYQVVEPRPVFVNGRLQYLMSIIPTSHNSVTKSVIVDAASNKVVALFNHDTDPDADTKLIRYLKTGVLDQSAVATPQDVGQPGKTPTTQQSVAQLLKENERLLEQVRENQAEIRKLLQQRRPP
jgi:hypothetical protein